MTGCSVVGRDLVDADVAGESQLASVLADVSLHLLGDVEILDALAYE